MVLKLPSWLVVLVKRRKLAVKQLWSVVALQNVVSKKKGLLGLLLLSKRFKFSRIESVDTFMPA